MSIINQPTIYDTPTIYNTGAGGGEGSGIVVFGGVAHRYFEINGFTILSENFKLKFNGGNGQSIQDDKYKYAYGFALNLSAVNFLQTNKDSIIPGWHIPTKSEYEAFLDSLSLNVSNAYTKLKSKLWDVNADDVGFSALPNGGSYSGGWQQVNIDCFLRTQDGFVFAIRSGSSEWASLTYEFNQFPIRLFKD